MNHTQLNELVKQNLTFCSYGKVANYIPALAEVKPSQLGVSIYNVKTNEILSSGDSDVRFAIESMSKVPVFLLAIEDWGIDYILDKVNTEPTGFAFNSILNMEINHQKLPMNPFVNSGAIATSSLVKESTDDERFDRILSFMKLLCNDDTIYLNTEIYQSESKTGDVNRSLAYYLKGNGMLDGEVDPILDVYFKQCSLMVTATDMAKLAAVLANRGVAPWNNQQLISPDSATLVKSIMTTAGLYDESGSFSAHVGIPAKSGVGGGLMGVSPKNYGIGVFSPPLDQFGNSFAGIKLLRDIVAEMNLDIFD